MSAPGGSAFGAFERMIAFRYLRARRKRSFISVIAGFSFVGIALGVGVLIVVMAVMNGFRIELLDRILGVNGHVIVHSSEPRFSDYESLSSRLSGVPGVRLSTPLVERQALASREGIVSGVLVRGVEGRNLRSMPWIADNVVEGSLEGFDGKRGAAIGSGMATRLGLRVGDRIALISPEGNLTPFGSTPRVKAYPVSAIFRIGMSEYDSSILFLPLSEAQLFFNMEGVVSTVELHTLDADRIEDFLGSISEALGPSHYLLDWRERNLAFFSALEVERNVMFMILALIILVAALNIVSGLTMLVRDKSRDIAILRAMGAGRGSILRIFLMTGVSIGVSGTIAGFILGVIFIRNIESIQVLVEALTGSSVWDPTIRFLSRIPARMDWNETLATISMALFLSFATTIFPAWRAARLDPVEALRYE